MGYRHYLGVIDKNLLEELKNKTYNLTTEEIEDGYSQEIKKFWEIKALCSRRFEIGKLYFEETNDIYNTLYNSCERIVLEEDYELFIPNQKVFFELANVYINKAKNYYKELIAPFKELFVDEPLTIDFENLNKEKQMSIYRCVSAIEHNYFRLNFFTESQKDLEISFDYELEAFNLMFFHKTFNPEKEIIICYAY